MGDHAPAQRIVVVIAVAVVAIAASHIPFRALVVDAEVAGGAFILRVVPFQYAPVQGTILKRRAVEPHAVRGIVMPTMVHGVICRERLANRNT